MRVYINFNQVRGPYGGANSFLRTLSKWLRRRGVHVTTDASEPVDVALINALTDGVDVNTVRRIAARGVPVLHRKVGYGVSGSAEMRAVTDGVVEGDRRQLEFDPYVRHTIFQSAYSRDVFLAGGFSGAFSVIHNGCDDELFNQMIPPRWLRRGRRRDYWNGSEPFRIVISSWSTDPNKGFDEYRRVDAALSGRRDLECWFVGRLPTGLRFRTIRAFAARPARRLAALLKRAHVVLQLARQETCSNALIEGINCGLPAVYLDSGSNKEIAGEYGAEYHGDITDAVLRVQQRYAQFVSRTQANPYRMSVVVDKYIDLFASCSS
jgi:glycosyltransferase involved in cell wall biosynthesis